MKIIDKNGWLNPPVGYEPVELRLEGSFLRIVYAKGNDRIDVVLEKHGREVARTQYEVEAPRVPALKISYKPEPSAIERLLEFLRTK